MYGVMKTKVMVDLGYHVVQNLMELCDKKNEISSFLYPRLITLFCLRVRAEVTSCMPDWRFTKSDELIVMID